MQSSFSRAIYGVRRTSTCYSSTTSSSCSGRLLTACLLPIGPNSSQALRIPMANRPAGPSPGDHRVGRPANSSVPRGAARAHLSKANHCLPPALPCRRPLIPSIRSAALAVSGVQKRRWDENAAVVSSLQTPRPLFVLFTNPFPSDLPVETAPSFDHLSEQKKIPP